MIANVLDGVENSRIRLNSAQFQLKLPARAELGKNKYHTEDTVSIEYNLKSC